MRLGEHDILYVMKNGPHDDELRHSLRSVAANVPHRRIWIVGHKPDWVRNVHHIPTNQSTGRRYKYRNVLKNLRAAAERPGLTERFVFFNDDFFVMRSITELPNLNRGPLADLEVKYRKFRWGKYYQAIVRTGRMLRGAGWPEPVSYDLHMPMLMEKRKVRIALGWIEAQEPKLPPVLFRTVYGNLFEAGGKPVGDVKIYPGKPFDGRATILSTDDESFAREPVGRYIRQQFPDPCRYEKLR